MSIAPSLGSLAPEGSTVLLVDDDVLVRADMAGQLRAAGHTVVEAESADAAKALLESAIEVDLVCTDVRMPGKLNGLGLTRWIRAYRRELPVVIVSGETTARDRANLADATFTKPVDIDRLSSCICALLAGRRRSAGAVT